MFHSDRRRMPRETPDITERMAQPLISAIIRACTPKLIGRPNTWLKPVLIWVTPRPSDWDTPKAVMATARISTVWPMGP
ncbi:hypothetical protein D9M70_610600 [compost metagenome]